MLATQYTPMNTTNHNNVRNFGQHLYLQNRKQNIPKLPHVFFSTAPVTPD